MRLRTKLVVWPFLLLIIFIAIWHNVSLKLTPSEKAMYSELFSPLNLPADLSKSSYEEQVAAIRSIHTLTFKKINRGLGIPFNTSREPENAMHFGEGECYDRTRFLEKALRYKGLKARHVSIYPNQDDRNALGLLLSTGIPSHATTEVQTAKGWLIVDSNYDWLSLDSIGDPIGMNQLENSVKFQSPVPDKLRPFYLEDIVFVYGLYSRHGRFFAPYTPLPDINYRELLFNF